MMRSGWAHPGMPRVSISWPGDEPVNFRVIDEEDEGYSNLADTLAFLVSSGWLEEESDGEGVEFGSIFYPDGIRVYVDGKRTSLKAAHGAVERGLGIVIRGLVEGEKM